MYWEGPATAIMSPMQSGVGYTVFPVQTQPPWHQQVSIRSVGGERSIWPYQGELIVWDPSLSVLITKLATERLGTLCVISCNHCSTACLLSKDSGHKVDMPCMSPIDVKMSFQSMSKTGIMRRERPAKGPPLLAVIDQYTFSKGKLAIYTDILYIWGTSLHEQSTCTSWRAHWGAQLLHVIKSLTAKQVQNSAKWMKKTRRIPTQFV